MGWIAMVGFVISSNTTLGNTAKHKWWFNAETNMMKIEKGGIFNNKKTKTFLVFFHLSKSHNPPFPNKSSEIMNYPI